jgi:integrase
MQKAFIVEAGCSVFEGRSMATIRKRPLPSGKTVWQCDYRDGAGKRRSRQFDKKRDADAFLVRARAEVAQGIHTPDSASTTVAQAGKQWVERGEAEGLEASTLAMYEQHVRLHINPRIGDVKLSRLTTPMVEKFRDQLVADLSREMARKVLRSLKSLLKEAQRRGQVAQNAAAATSVRIAGRESEEVLIPTKAHMRLMLAQAPARWRPLIVMALFTGLRSSELRGLTWEHVDLEARVLKVRQRVDRYGKMGPPKSRAGRRDVPLAPMVVNTLKEWRLACPPTLEGLVFPTDRGKITSTSGLHKAAWRPTLVAAGVMDKDGPAPYKFHALRHGAASLFIEQGMSPKRVQVVMGHSTITVTYDLYGHLFPDLDDDLEAMASIEARLLAQ